MFMRWFGVNVNQLLFYGGNEYQKLIGKIEDIDMSYSKYKKFDD